MSRYLRAARVGVTASGSPPSWGRCSRWDSPFHARLTRWATTSSFFGLRASSHHWPVSAVMPTSICEYIGASFGSNLAGRELPREQVLDLGCDVDDEAGEVAGLLGRPASRGPGPGSRRGTCRCSRTAPSRACSSSPRAWPAVSARLIMPSSRLHLPVDDDGVQALLAAEVLVDHGLGHLRLVRDLLDGDGLVALLREQACGPTSISCSRRCWPVIRTGRAGGPAPRDWRLRAASAAWRSVSDTRQAAEPGSAR